MGWDWGVAENLVIWRRDARFSFFKRAWSHAAWGAQRQAKTPRPFVLLGLECGPPNPHPRVPRLRISVFSHAYLASL